MCVSHEPLGGDCDGKETVSALRKLTFQKEWIICSVPGHTGIHKVTSDCEKCCEDDMGLGGGSQRPGGHLRQGFSNKQGASPRCKGLEVGMPLDQSGRRVLGLPEKGRRDGLR